MWINTQTLNVYKYIHEIRQDFTNKSLPENLTNSVLEQLSILPIIRTEQPKTNPATQTVEELAPEQETSGRWVIKWKISELTQLERVAATAQQWTSIRTERNSKIAATDWTQVDDAPFTNVEKAAWATYRQALRDITTQADPFAIEWPQAPNEVSP